MSTIREKIVEILNTDAQSADVGKLGALLDKRGSAPYGVYFMSPPEAPDVPFITYHFLGETFDWTDEIYFNVSIYSDNFETIQNRIIVLLDQINLESTERRVLLCRKDWVGPDLWDDNLKCYVKHIRFFVRAK